MGAQAKRKLLLQQQLCQGKSNKLGMDISQGQCSPIDNEPAGELAKDDDDLEVTLK